MAAMTSSSPIVILLGSSFPSPSTSPARDAFFTHPHAHARFHGKPLIEHWWDTLSSAGLASSTHVFVATNATQYKYFEFWALGKGIPVSHIINSGRTLGDDRVDMRTLVQVMHKAARTVAHTAAGEHGGTDFLVIACDSAPPHTGAAFAASLAAMVASATTAVFLQPPHAECSAGSPFQAGAGPVIRAYHVRADTPAGRPAAPAEGSHDSDDVQDVVKDLKISVDLDSHHEPPIAQTSGTLTSFSPMVYLIKGADAAVLMSAPVLKELTTICSTFEGIAVADDGVASLGGKLARKHAGSVPSAVVNPFATVVIPIEAGIAWLARHRLVHGIRLHEKFQIGAADGSEHATNVGGAVSASSQSLAASTAMSSAFRAHHEPIVASAFARVGVLGNPSDGFGGKTLSVTIRNFHAEAMIMPRSDSSIALIPHDIYDATSFANLRHVSTIAGREGYSGGIRLMAAALHRFFLHCRSVGVELPEHGFTARYHTTVPKQVGLAGSSAILTAFVRALLQHYGFGTEEKAASIGLSRDKLPTFVLSVESEELGITAGLQDRVVQSYEGLVHMDFNADLMKAQGFGRYTKLPSRALPPLFLAYAADPSDSGRIHAPVKQRWLAGDADVVDGMLRIASLADAGLSECSTRPYANAAPVDREAIAHAWASLMAQNFDLRRKLFGDAALGRDNIRMVEIAREVGASAKFPGSGGAIIGVVDVEGIEAKGRLPVTAPVLDPAAPPDVQERICAARLMAATETIRDAYLAEGYVFALVEPFES